MSFSDKKRGTRARAGHIGQSGAGVNGRTNTRQVDSSDSFVAPKGRSRLGTMVRVYKSMSLTAPW